MRTAVTHLLFAGLFAAGAAGCGGAAQTAVATPRAATPAPVVAAAPEAEPLDEDPPEGKDGYLLNVAVTQMDEGEMASAIRTLESLRRKHPNNGMILHELALAYRLSRRPGEAVTVLMPYRHRLSVATLASLASALDEAGKPKEAIAMLREELLRHPTSGLLHSELGTTLVNQGKQADALALYEKSTEVDPGFAPSYMHLAEIYATTRSRGLTLLHGETFRVLEPSSGRSERIAKLMVQVCDAAVELNKSSAGAISSHVSLAPDILVSQAGDVAELPIVNQFELVFGPPLTAAHIQGLSLATLHGARRAYLDAFKRKSGPEKLAGLVLTRWLRALDDAGHLEAYDYWLFGPADTAAQGAWFAAHAPQLEGMIKYLLNHPLYPKEQEPGQTPSNVTAQLEPGHDHEVQRMWGGRGRAPLFDGASLTRPETLTASR